VYHVSEVVMEVFVVVVVEPPPPELPLPLSCAQVIVCTRQSINKLKKYLNDILFVNCFMDLVFKIDD
jgi:hypothetical protein